MSFTRQMLERWFPGDKRMQLSMELQRDSVASLESGLQTTAESTVRIEQASVLVLAGNNAFENERVLQLDSSLLGVDDGKTLNIKTSAVVPRVAGGFTVSLAAQGNSQFAIPLYGTLATTENPETFKAKTLNAPKIALIGNYVDDAAAATGGVPLNGIYHNAGVLRVRLV